MKNINIGNSGILGSEISLGCMRISKMELKEVYNLVKTSLDLGINFFDHADIYGGGESETVFSKAIGMNSSIREKMILQSKCGIRKGQFDFSKEHIINSVDGILKRLNTEYLDILLLHRPDALVEPEEVAYAFDYLQNSGKVRQFGVSNHTPMQIELLKTCVNQKIVANQLQFSVCHTKLIDNAMNTNMLNEASVNRSESGLEYMRIKGITIQTWSSIQYGFFSGTFLDNDKFPELNSVLERIALENNTNKSAVAIAWILRHPAKMQAIIGTTQVSRVQEMAQASDINLSREQWYEIYLAAGNKLP